jgi:hypothetical protein
LKTYNVGDSIEAPLIAYYEFVARRGYRQTEIWAKWADWATPKPASFTAQAVYLNAVIERLRDGTANDTELPKSLVDFFYEVVDRPLAIEVLGEDYFA